MLIKLNVGPGKTWSHPGWKTLDVAPDADFVCDLRASPRLPLPSHSASVIFSSHVIEHLPDEAVISLFREAHRVLAYRGIFRVTCPDIEKAIQQYRKGDCDPYREVVSKPAADAPSHHRLLNVLASFRAPRYRGKRNTPRAYVGGPFATKAVVREKVDTLSLEELVRWAVSLIPENATYRAHINGHWPAKVMRMLREAGFADVYISKYRKSRNLELRDEAFDNRPHISLFVEARAVGPKKRIADLGWRVLCLFSGPPRRS
jgi:ubiquinone/menaquinone biosynthesis C-methylase UbiE